MKLLYSFILKDINEIRGNRKILLYACIGLLYPVILNVMATNPIIPMEFIIIFAAIFTTCMSEEFLYCFTINEIKYRIFDIFLISKVGKLRLILYKCALPSLCSFSAAFASIVIYNVSVVIFPGFGVTAEIMNYEIIILISGAIISALIEFGAIISIDKFNDRMHTLTLLISFIAIIFIYIAEMMLGATFSYAITLFIILVLVLSDYNLINLYNRTTLIGKRYVLRSIFPERTISDISALLRKEFIVSGCNWFTLISLVISSAFPLFIYSFSVNNIELLQVLFRVTLYFVCNFGVLNILFPVIKTEQINRSADLFKVAEISEFKIYFSKCILPFFSMLSGLILSFSVTWVYCKETHNVFLFDFITIVTSISSTLCSVLISMWFSRYIYSHKDVRIIRFFIISATFVLHVLISFCPYLFF